MRIASVGFSMIAAAALVAWRGEAAAQSAPGTHFNRVRSGGGEAKGAMRPSARRAPAIERTATASRGAIDPLAPYTARPRAGSGSPSVAPPAPPKRPEAIPVVRNYFPTARGGQVQHHCTPSRSGLVGNRR